MSSPGGRCPELGSNMDVLLPVEIQTLPDADFLNFTTTSINNDNSHDLFCYIYFFHDDHIREILLLFIIIFKII